MGQVLMGKPTDERIDRSVLEEMFRLRHTVFRERLGWEVSGAQGQERDPYDDLAPVYIIARNDQRKVEGCWRILSTTGPYMLKDTFPELLRGEPAPTDPNVWELSRFAVNPVSRFDCRQAHFGCVTLNLMRSLADFARDHGVQSFVTVTSVALERMMRKMGIPLRRFGDGKALRIGTVLSVACWIPANEESRRALYATLDGERRAA
ncbi:MAG: acyl-homoserine-lactone synthase [Gammaproteobacteria bacterium]